MKKLVILAMILTSSLSFAGTIKVKVSGMVCSMCAQGIEKKFSALPEVQHIKVSLDDKEVNIHTKEGKEVKDSKIKELIKEAGYNVAGIERK